MMTTIRILGFSMGWLLAAAGAAWACAAFYFDLPWPAMRGAAALGLMFVFIGMVIFLRGPWLKLGAVYLGFILVLGWWLSLKPSHDRPWQPEGGEISWALVDGDTVTLNNVRNFDYRSESDFTPRWETRSVRLSQLTGVDLAITYWGSPYMAHPIASFQFADSPPVAFSIETRKEIGESYSAIGGFFRQYELIYIAADERDVIRVRTNYRKGEDVYLYRTSATAEQAREWFMEYLAAMNQLRDEPRWYHALTTNCTTAIRTQHAAEKRAAWDWRMIVNGKADEMMFERGSFRTDGLAFPELKSRARVNEAALAAGASADFSERIRAAAPGS